MDIANETQLPDEMIEMINRCRLYLRAERMSDICSASGKFIRESAANCSDEARVSTLEDWPRQPRPDKRRRKAWKLFLKSIYGKNYALRENLGNWSSASSGPQWKAYYDPCWQIGVTRDDDGRWYEREVTEKTRRGWLLSADRKPIDFDNEYWIPVDIRKTATGIDCISTPLHICIDEPRPQKVVIWDYYLRTLPSWERDLVGITHEMENSRGLADILIDEKEVIFMVSDGGL